MSARYYGNRKGERRKDAEKVSNQDVNWMILDDAFIFLRNFQTSGLFIYLGAAKTNNMGGWYIKNCRPTLNYIYV
jgi:hypothetical protein